MAILLKVSDLTPIVVNPYRIAVFGIPGAIG